MRQIQNFPPQNYHRQQFLISTETSKLDLAMIHDFLTHKSYWAAGIDKQTVEKSIKNSLCFGVYDCSVSAPVQIGFARVITDFACFAYLADVFILLPFRGQELGKWLISCILSHPELQRLRKWMLNTKDAHKLYERFGFQLHTERDTYMSYRPKLEAAR